MKKCLVLLTLSCITSLFVFTGCNIISSNTNDNYSSYIIGGSDSAGVSSSGENFSLWSTEKQNYHVDGTAPKTKKVTFQGVDYTAEYDSSVVRVPNLFTSHKYWGKTFSFEINAQTGELTSFSLFSSITPTFSVGEAEAKKVADAFAKNYINLSQYKVDAATHDANNNCFYIFDYYKEVDGFKTNDAIKVILDGEARVVSFGSYMLGSFKNIRSASIDKEKAELALEDKITALYKEYSNASISYEVKDVILTVIDSKTKGLLYSVSVDITYLSEADNTESKLTDLVQILITN